MERHRAIRRQRLLDGETGQLVAEGDAVGLRGDHPRGQALLEVRQIGGRQRLEQPHLGVRRHDGDRLEQAGAGADRRARRASTASRTVAGISPGARREHLGDVERIAVGAAMQIDRIDPVRLGQLADRPLRERRDDDPRDRSRRAQLPEHQCERVRAVELVVAVAGQDERGHGLDLACQQAHHVERRLVGPVEVLEHENGGASAGQLADERAGDLVRPSVARDELLELAARQFGYVEQGAQRARREQRRAGAPEDPRRVAPLIAELPNQSGLADARLAPDEDHRPGPTGGDRVERVSQGRQLIGALEQHLWVPLALRGRDVPEPRRQRGHVLV